MHLLQTEILHWVNATHFNLDNYSDDSSLGFFLEVDLDYKVTKEVLSEYQVEIIKENKFSLGKKKLIPNLNNQKPQTLT